MDHHERRGPGSYDEPGPRRSPDRRGRDSLDPYERAVLRGEDPDAPADGGETPPLPKLTAGPLRVGSLGLLAGLLVIVALAALARSGDGAPGVAADCDTPGLELSTALTRPGGLVEFTAVGPAEEDVVVAVNARGVDPATLAVDPQQGRTAQRATERLSLTGCRVTGRFGVQVGPGLHEVVLLRVTDEGSRPLARRPLEVIDR